MAKLDDAPAPRRLHIESYPWHEDVWRSLTRNLSRLHHALLLHGPRGVGKTQLGLRIAQTLLCEKPREQGACGACRGCELFVAGNHPDFLFVAPQEEDGSILVDQVRAVGEFLALRPHSAGRKVVVVSPADAMNVNAANSLLKILEEPPADSQLVLVATHVARMAATIRSRCARIGVEVPNPTLASRWLASRAPQAQALLGQAGGAPLQALALAQDDYAQQAARLEQDLAALAKGAENPVSCAARWKAAGARMCLEWLQRTVEEAIALTMQIDRTPNSPAASIVRKFNFPVIDLFHFLDMVSSNKRLLGTGVDESSILESSLIRWCEMAAAAD